MDEPTVLLIQENTLHTKFYWSWTNFPFGDHAAIYFGKDRGGADYWFSKNGTGGPLKITTTNELQKSYNLYDFFRTDYKKK